MQLGFDLSKAIDSLRRAANEEGAFPPGDPSGRDPALVALSHLHGIEHDRRCTKNPCRLAALCLALHELLQYQSEKPRADVLDEFGVAGASLDAASERLGQATTITGHNGLPALNEGQREQLVQLRADIEQVCAKVEELAGDVILTIWSAQLLQPPGKKAGDLLLRAVWQYLHDGGFTHEEAFELVPTLGTHTKAKDIVRKRIKEPDSRTLSPREVNRELFEPPKVERRRRRRPPPDRSS